MSAHTPGHWRFYTEPQPNGCPIVGADGLMVCMLAHTVNQPEQRDEALANARLIAAAPDLLAALKELIAAGDECVSSDDDVASMLRFGEAHDAAREVVDKATGAAL